MGGADPQPEAAGLGDVYRRMVIAAVLRQAGRKRVVENFDYRVVARKFVDLVSEKLNVD